ncbi:hypothetical protein DFH94DRAFT_233122 [Russula ochroleuca]|uniref:Uncharacterized protein n=1 Tax=Russula ochroleuca TaxID=152965 RepID=A0A9P5TCG7_9AGAM|nr:hypothetical protein DFH94DRAFT_233122 [Russula ochroleuca]
MVTLGWTSVSLVPAPAFAPLGVSLLGVPANARFRVVSTPSTSSELSSTAAEVVQASITNDELGTLADTPRQSQLMFSKAV